VDSATLQGILDSACDALASEVLYREHFPEDGMDEHALVSGLISALHDVIAETRGGRGEDGGCRRSAAAAPVLAAFHVGITRAQGNNIGRTAAAHVRELLRALASSGLAGQAADMLVAGISATLFDDIGAERDFGQGRTPLTGCDGDSSRIEAWWRAY
jgi:hypothetical protein